MASKFRQLYEQNVMRSLDKQKAVTDVYPQQQWGFDAAKSELHLVDSDVRFHVQILGSEDYANGTWQWAWTDQTGRFPSHGLVAAKKMQLLGEKYGIPEFSNSQCDLDSVSAMDIATIASGVLDATCYWAIGSPEQGSIYMLIMPEQLAVQPNASPLALATSIPQTIGAIEIENHKRAIRSYINSSGYQASESDGDVALMKGGEPKITLSFDELNRLTGLKTKLTADDAVPTQGSEVAEGADVAVAVDPAPIEATTGEATDAAITEPESLQDDDGFAVDTEPEPASAGSALTGAGVGLAGGVAAGLAGVAAGAGLGGESTSEADFAAVDDVSLEAGSLSDATGSLSDATPIEPAKAKKGGLLKILLPIVLVLIILAVLYWWFFLRG